MYLIVIEAAGAGKSAYRHQPYRLANTPNEARELMRDYMRLGPETGALAPDYFALYQEKHGEFGSPEYFDPCSIELPPTDAAEWLHETGRI